MIKTVPIDTIFNFIAGQVIALSASKQLKRGVYNFTNPYFLSVLLIEIFTFLPIGVYFYFSSPSWSLMYFVNADNLSPAVGALFLMFYPLAIIFGYIVALNLIKKDKIRALYQVLGLTILVLLIFSILTYNRLSNVGSYAEYISRQATPLLEHYFTTSVVVAGAIFVIPLLFIIIRFRKEGQGIA